MPSEAQIQALDGPALTRLAWELGLGGATREYVGSAGTRLAAPAAEGDLLELWEPHEDLAQAEICFRALRARGWKTRVEGTTRAGAVWADHAGGLNGVLVTWPSPHAATEPHALLLASVLATASEEEEKKS